MIRSKKKLLAVITAIVIVTMTLIPTTYAAQTKKMLEAWFGVKITYNNSELISSAQPFIVNNTAYVPLRMLMDNFGKDITWDGTNYKVVINDKENTTEAYLRGQILQKDVRIAELEKQVREFQSKKVTISSLEDDLNDDYGSYQSINFDITLSGDEDKITVKIDVDEDDWDDLSSTRQKSYLQDICDDIDDAFNNADIAGSVKDGSKTLKSFETNSSGAVTYTSSSRISDLEDELNDDYEDYWNSKGIPSLDITLEGNEDDITFKVCFDNGRYDDEWAALTSDQKKDLLQRICDDILDEFDDAEIEGFAYDTDDKKNLARYYRDTNGTRYFNIYKSNKLYKNDSMLFSMESFFMHKFNIAKDFNHLL